MRVSVAPFFATLLAAVPVGASPHQAGAKDARVRVIDGGARVVVTPFGEDDDAPTHDWRSLTEAFRRVAPGGTVELAPGLYHVDRTVVGTDLVATIVGQLDEDGTPPTVLARGPDGVFPDGPQPQSAGDGPFVFWFRSSAPDRITDVTLQRLRIRAQGQAPFRVALPFCVPTVALGGAVLVAGSEAARWPAPPAYTPSSMSFTAREVDVRGSREVPDFITGAPMSNLQQGILAWNGVLDSGSCANRDEVPQAFIPFTGRIDVADSTFEELALSGVWVVADVARGYHAPEWSYDAIPASAPAASISVERNRFTRVGYWVHWWGVMFMDTQGLAHVVRGNLMRDSAGYSFLWTTGYSNTVFGSSWYPTPGPGDRSALLVEGNDIAIRRGIHNLLIGDLNPIGLYDWHFAAGLDVDPVAIEARANRIHFEPDESGVPFYAAAIYGEGVDDVRVEDNLIDGPSKVGVRFGSDQWCYSMGPNDVWNPAQQASIFGLRFCHNRPYTAVPAARWLVTGNRIADSELEYWAGPGSSDSYLEVERTATVHDQGKGNTVDRQ